MMNVIILHVYYTDNLLIKLKFGPTVHCVSWTVSNVICCYLEYKSCIVSMNAIAGRNG